MGELHLSLTHRVLYISYDQLKPFFGKINSHFDNPASFIYSTNILELLLPSSTVPRAKPSCCRGLVEQEYWVNDRPSQAHEHKEGQLSWRKAIWLRESESQKSTTRLGSWWGWEQANEWERTAKGTGTWMRFGDSFVPDRGSHVKPSCSGSGIFGEFIRRFRYKLELTLAWFDYNGQIACPFIPSPRFLRSKPRSDFYSPDTENLSQVPHDVLKGSEESQGIHTNSAGKKMGGGRDLKNGGETSFRPGCAC